VCFRQSAIFDAPLSRWDPPHFFARILQEQVIGCFNRILIHVPRQIIGQLGEDQRLGTFLHLK